MSHSNRPRSRMAAAMAAISLCLLAACGGGGDSGSDTSVATTRRNLEFANINSTGFPWLGRQVGMSKRWNLPIPVQTNGETRAVAAMDALEARFGAVLFDRQTLVGIAPGSVTRGLVFSQGTSYLPSGGKPSSFCANVSAAPFASSYPGNFVQAGGEISTRLFINLDNPQCTASIDITIHELGHAMGLGPHFEGFGDGDAISPAFWAALLALYRNPIGTSAAAMVYP